MQASTPAFLLQIRALVVYPKEIAFIIRKGKKTAATFLIVMKKALGKEEHHVVTLGEVTDYLGIDALSSFALLREKGCFKDEDSLNIKIPSV